MTLTKADIAKKIADDCGFMKGRPPKFSRKCSTSSRQVSLLARM